MHTVDTHCFEVAPELDIAYDRDDVFEKTLEASTILDSEFYSLVEALKATLCLRYFRFDPGCKVERVVKYFLMRGASLYGL